MQIFLVRHGAAQDGAPGGDRQRALTPEGREAFRRVAEQLAREPERPEAIWSSPLVRAEQTAEILAACLRLSAPVETVDALAPGADAAAILALLEGEPPDAKIAIVGHEPDLSTLAFVLCGQAQAFRKGAIWRIDFPGVPAAGKGELVWRMAP